LLVGLQGLGIALLLAVDGSELAFAHGNTAQIPLLFSSAYRFLVGSGRSVVTAQVAQTIALFR
jgi:hypothetical protein